MTRVRAVVFPRPKARAELVELPLPELEPDSALLDVECSEVCGTDLHLQNGMLQGVPYPLIPGHVTVGRLGQVRGRVADVHGNALREGERVTFLDVHQTCHACWYCLVAKASTRCPARKVYGITYGAADGLCGGWAEKLYLKPGTRVIPLGAAAPEAFMAGGCALPTALHAVEKGRLAIGDRVLVLGAGPVGLSLAILARLSGAGCVLVIGAPEARLLAARGVAAHATLDFTAATPDERGAWVRAETEGRGADVTFEATGAPEAVVHAMRMTRDAGRVVVVGQYTDHGETAFSPHRDLNKKHLEVLGCWGSDYSHFHRAVQVACSEELGAAWRKLPLAEFGLAQANEALAAVAGGGVVKALIRP